MQIFAFQKIASVIDAEALKCSSASITDAIGPDCWTHYKNDTGKIISMECLKCRDDNISYNKMIKFDNNCFKIILYNESKIIFNISEISFEKDFGTCLYFGKAIYSGQYECVDIPHNSYYILKDENENTGVIKNCHKACNTCLGEGNSQNTNCIECSKDYIKIEDSDTHCIEELSFSSNYYSNNTDINGKDISLLEKVN